VALAAPAAPTTGSFRHEAVFHRGLGDLLAVVLPFVRAGVRSGEPVLVVERTDRIAAVRRALGRDAAYVDFLDVASLGRNPTRMIAVWRDLVTAHPGRPVRGVGEHAWAELTSAELDECRVHESLLDVVFAGAGADFALLCPYDAGRLPGDVIAAARRAHPGRGHRPRSTQDGHARALDELSRALPAPPAAAEEIRFGEGDLTGLRSVVRRLCGLASLRRDTVDDLVLAVHELATNSVRHGGGHGVLRGWREPGSLVLEVSDDGVITDPTVGRHLAPTSAEGVVFGVEVPGSGNTNLN